MISGVRSLSSQHARGNFVSISHHNSPPRACCGDKEVATDYPMISSLAHQGPRVGQAHADVSSIDQMPHSHLGQRDALAANVRNACAASLAEAKKILELSKARYGCSPPHDARGASVGKPWPDPSSVHSSPRSQDAMVMKAASATDSSSWQVARNTSKKKHKRRNAESCAQQDRAVGSRRATHSLPQYASWGRD